MGKVMAEEESWKDRPASPGEKILRERGGVQPFKRILKEQKKGRIPLG